MSTEEKAIKEVDKASTGYIAQSLGRSSKAIRAERGEAIAEDLEMSYKREIEDLQMELKRKRRDQLNMFDFGGTSTFSLVIAKDVDAAEIKEQDLFLALEIRNLNISLDLVTARYAFLFGNK